MTDRRRAAACLPAAARSLWSLLSLLTLVSLARSAAAQSIRLSIPSVSSDSISPAPAMLVDGFETQPEAGPYSMSLDLSLESQFRAPFYSRNVTSETATFSIDSLLPERNVVYFRARLLDRFGNVVAEARDQHPVRSWLRLIPQLSPNTLVPRFYWSSPPITVPPGLWDYDVSVINNASGKVEFTQTDIQDTSFVFPTPLESNTSYRWQVHARAENGVAADQTTVASNGSFVITPLDQPAVTLFYQNFPNPFGRGTPHESTCFWFDLSHEATVTITIYDITLRTVRRIVPGATSSGIKLPVGVYGRQNLSEQPGGCDDRFAWDGRDDTGRFVPAGVYLAIFKGDGVRTSVKMLYRGP
ncbi:MAG TPA: hypothetical protein VGM67_15085 [Gemmatimonadaceae bacterium]|jgi:hypothetical protein